MNIWEGDKTSRGWRKLQEDPHKLQAVLLNKCRCMEPTTGYEMDDRGSRNG